MPREIKVRLNEGLTPEQVREIYDSLHRIQGITIPTPAITVEGNLPSLDIDLSQKISALEAALGDGNEQKENVLAGYTRLTIDVFGDYIEVDNSEQLAGVYLSIFGENIVKTVKDRKTRAQITEREFIALIERYGLENGQAKTYKKTGDELGLSASHTKIIIEKALGILRYPTNSQKVSAILARRPSRLRQAK